MEKPKVAIVPLSEVMKSPGMRLDPGYYLGTSEEHAYGMAKRTFRHAIKRLLKTQKEITLARWRVFRWRVEGRIRYK